MDGEEILEDPGYAEPEEPEAQEVQEEPEVVEEAPVHEPPEDHPRFNQIYGQMKQHERDLAESREQNELIRQEYAKLSQALDTVQDKVSKTERPDPIDDPEGYDNWVMDRVKREVSKVAQPEPAPQRQQQPQGNPVLQIMEKAIADAKPDYWDAFNDVAPEMEKNPALHQKIFGSQNPPLELYNYWEGKKGKATQQRQDNINQGYVEGGTRTPVSGGKYQLSAAQKKTADALGIPHEKFAKHAEFTEKRGY